MTSIAPVITYLCAGALLANVATAWALSSHRPTWQRLLAPVACLAAWLAASVLLDDGWPGAELPGHAAAVATAIFCVAGFPVFVVQRWRRR
ncbi:hypothetical protein ACG04Q_10775 [Roseateles sp. DXS20W]|uniref:DUF3649 domain-containing protein n=1 Tax=Pelomonas lactea TaxID=3299030 RepID=A0ABW7GJP0_9BURK